MLVPEHLRQPRPDNPSSWHWIIAFYEYVLTLSSDYKERYTPFVNLCRHLNTTPYAERFRASQAQHDLVIAFKDRIALEEGDPCVLVYADCRRKDIYVERWPEGMVARVGEFGMSLPLLPMFCLIVSLVLKNQNYHVMWRTSN